jgi:DNA segregation ATPase FtsK/SpoIIIE-like protein
LIQRERAVLGDLFRLVAERAAVEPRIDRDFKSDQEALEEEFEITYQAIIVRFASEKETAEAEIQEVRKDITRRFSAERAAVDKELADTRARVLRRYEGDKKAAKTEFQEARWTINAVYEGSKNGAETQLQDAQRRQADAVQRLRTIDQESRAYLEACRLASKRSKDAGAPASRPGKEPVDQLQEFVEFADWKLVELKGLAVPRWIKGTKLIWGFIGLWLVALAICFFAIRADLSLPNIIWSVAACTGGVALIALIAWLWLYSVARAQVGRVYQPLTQALAGGRALLKACEEQLTVGYHRQLGEAKKRYNKEVRQASDKYSRLRAECKQRRVEGLRQTTARYRQQRTDLKERRTREWSEASTRYRRKRADMQKRYHEDSERVQNDHNRQKAERAARHEKQWQALASAWHDGMARVSAEITAIQQETGLLFPDWVDPSWNNWVPSRVVPPVIRFGVYEVSLAQIPNGEPRHARLRGNAPTRYHLPALLSFPEPCSVLIRASEEGRAPAVQALQVVMLRLLTSLPPGKVRFTIIDPVGLGKNFASFMHLADHDEALVTSRIWTEMPHIDQRLADLTGHMENVIQKYLRNQFETIEEYNVHAGEVAEPYRILVVANFPFNFSTDAARRLVSIVSSGPRCGVHTLITVDTKHPLPQGFTMADLEQPGVKLVWENDRFIWQDDDFEHFPLELDAPPPEALCRNLLQMIGQRALEAKRVEVPFEFVAPGPEQWWTGDSRPGLNVPLGRVGATKRQYLKLGQGTAQHVLIAGKTGSGKSTLLHALISNVALAYSPDEVELYLVDFKKGVEFKTYASHELPHARVVAVESEREFGLSVLQRLDAELKIRGDKFRAVGAQDLRAYRQASGNVPLPRILLIVDEFQEFFVEDDKLAQDAALLLDRLVRQGRAFGLHVLLGTQTLGGAYSLARSTIDQMAVRIALQCSEADANLILSEDNSAARLLSRPGEAIYNDANGLVEGNNPFQVVWLSEERREHYLKRIQELAQQRMPSVLRSQIVFEGNAPADPTKNDLLGELLRAPTWSAAPRSARAWLGEAIAIKDPTLAVFRPQSGNNLLLVGQQDDAALGILASTLVSLAAQYPPKPTPMRDGTQYYVIDGTPDDDPLVGMLARVAAALPHRVRVGAWRDLAPVMADLAAEVDRRQKETDTEAPTLYLLLFGLQRFRDLRRQEDDFSFSRSPDEKPNPAKQFATLLSEGPSVGIHTVVWCDSLNNVNRSLDRQTLREFEMRVLFQMGAGDSSNLIDSPAASKLGVHRAFFHTEEQGRLEKFRPYGLPADGWLEWVKQRLAEKQAAGELA